jgi:hypothetical protein
MRFDRFEHWQGRTENARRLAGAQKAIQREKDVMPLFAADITETASERIARLEAAGAAQWGLFRGRLAAMWRRGRAALRASPNASKLAAEWQRSPVPGSAEYMLDFLRRRGVSVPSA